MKTCSICKTMKPLDAYYGRPSAIDGRYSHCIECHKLKTREQRSKYARYNPELRKQKRLEALKRYGGKCVCCGETETVFLAFDHVGDDGHIHRRTIGRNSIADWALKNGCPPTLQILCHNCNAAKSILGHCPHAIKRDIMQA